MRSAFDISCEIWKEKERKKPRRGGSEVLDSAVNFFVNRESGEARVLLIIKDKQAIQMITPF